MVKYHDARVLRQVRSWPDDSGNVDRPFGRHTCHPVFFDFAFREGIAGTLHVVSSFRVCSCKQNIPMAVARRPDI